jgi:hypothetical protein
VSFSWGIFKVFYACYGKRPGILSNHSAQTLTLVSCIREVTGSNLCRDSLYTDFGFFVVLFSPSREMSAQYLKLSHDRFLLYTSRSPESKDRLRIAFAHFNELHHFKVKGPQ